MILGPTTDIHEPEDDDDDEECRMKVATNSYLPKADSNVVQQNIVYRKNGQLFTKVFRDGVWQMVPCTLLPKRKPKGLGRGSQAKKKARKLARGLA